MQPDNKLLCSSSQRLACNIALHLKLHLRRFTRLRARPPLPRGRSRVREIRVKSGWYLVKAAGGEIPSNTRLLIQHRIHFMLGQQDARAHNLAHAPASASCRFASSSISSVSAMSLYQLCCRTQKRAPVTIEFFNWFLRATPQSDKIQRTYTELAAVMCARSLGCATTLIEQANDTAFRGRRFLQLKSSAISY